MENALKYGGAESEPPSITLHAGVDTDRLVVTITNNRASNTTGKATHGFGIGIANIRQRLELLYGGRAEFKMVEEDRRCQVTIAFPAVRQH
jgi:sensor histidine kinase YesM